MVRVRPSTESILKVQTEQANAMAAKPRLSKELARHLRAERQGRSTGTGEGYTPWIQLRRHDFASRGRSHMHPSAFMNRHIELLSDLELSAYLYVQLLNPMDVREQFRLQLNEVGPEFEDTHPEAPGTVAIARDLGLKHPKFSLNLMMPLTTDMVVFLPSGETVAIHVKYEAALLPKRATELRLIESEYWRHRGVALLTFTEKDVNAKQLANLHMFSSFNRKNVGKVDVAWLAPLATLARVLPMCEAVEKLSFHLGLRHAEVVDCVKFAGVTGQIRLDLTATRLQWSAVWPPITVSRNLHTVDLDLSAQTTGTHNGI